MFNHINLVVVVTDGVVQGGFESLPTALRDEDRVAVTPVDLGDGHVASLGVALHVKVEVLVLDPHLFGILPAAPGAVAVAAAAATVLVV